jgi:hypothetical protein
LAIAAVSSNTSTVKIATAFQHETTVARMNLRVAEP